MPKNLEIKSKYASASKAMAIARKIGASSQGTLSQTDTYFKVKSGRLKLREIDGRRFELIYYHRPNTRSSRFSDYTIIPVQDPRPVKAVLASVLGLAVVVRKKRTLFLLKNARIHIDSVHGLGVFIEFEVVVKRGKEQAKKLMRFLRKQFAIEKKMVLGGSYSDMIG
jgi:predicted adenylyl cyclase CyaB